MNKIIAFILLLILSPLMLLISILIKLTSKGPIIFKQQRHGLNGKVFWIYKFRTMYINSHYKKPAYEFENPKKFITFVGGLLRKTSLDELPQLFNILKGEMNFIGYRPNTGYNVEINKLRKQNKIYKLKPGITGLAQIVCRKNLNSKKTIVCDKYYVKNKNWLLNLKIIFVTIVFVLTCKNTTEQKNSTKN